MFPGQSSKYPDMIRRLLASAPAETRRTLGLATEVLGEDVASRFLSDEPTMFDTNRAVQLGVFLANHIHMLAAEAAGLSASLSIGLSLGEYNHLVHIGALDFAAAVQLVAKRGDAYDAGPPGAMASVFPLPLDELEPVVAEVAKLGLGVLEIANLNSPTQNVLSGARPALDEAMRRLDRELGVDSVLIEPRIAMHSSLFRPVAEALAPTLRAAPYRTPERLYLPNVIGDFEQAPTPARIAEHLIAHVCSPVLFRRSIDRLVAHAPDAAFVEVGPRAVLFNLLSRKWLSSKRFKTDTPEGPPRELAARSVEVRP